MIHYEFAQEIEAFEENYASGDKKSEYTRKQKDILWNEFKTVKLLSFQEMLSWLIKNCNFLPKTSKFYAALEAVQSDSGDGVGRDIRKIEDDCNTCDGLGLLWGIFNCPWAQCKFYTAVARCSCRNSENWSRAIPTVAMVESNKESGLIEWARPHHLLAAMNALKDYDAETEAVAGAVAEIEADGDNIPF